MTRGAPSALSSATTTQRALNPMGDGDATLLAEQLLVESGLGTCWSGYFPVLPPRTAPTFSVGPGPCPRGTGYTRC